MSEVTAEDMVDAVLRPITAALAAQKITPEYLAKKLKRELNAKETKVFHANGEVVYSKPMIAWGIRQKARQDAHKLLDHYPSEKHDVNVSGVIGLKQLLDDIDGETTGPTFKDAESNER